MNLSDAIFHVDKHIPLSMVRSCIKSYCANTLTVAQVRLLRKHNYQFVIPLMNSGHSWVKFDVFRRRPCMPDSCCRLLLRNEHSERHPKYIFRTTMFSCHGNKGQISKYGSDNCCRLILTSSLLLKGLRS